MFIFESIFLLILVLFEMLGLHLTMNSNVFSQNTFSTLAFKNIFLLKISMCKHFKDFFSGEEKC